MTDQPTPEKSGLMRAAGWTFLAVAAAWAAWSLYTNFETDGFSRGWCAALLFAVLAQWGGDILRAERRARGGQG